MQKGIQKIILVIFSAITFGFIGSLSMSYYGANSCDQIPDLSCDCICCHMFGLRGYESCSLFGLFLGTIVGLIMGVITYKYIKRKR